MERFALVRPLPAHEPQVQAFLNEYQQNDTALSEIGSLARYRHDYAEWLRYLASQRMIEPNGIVAPTETFFLVRYSYLAKSPLVKRCIIGIATVRLSLTKEYAEHGGNVGYCIRPSERGHGYNKFNLYLAIKYCARQGINEILIDCRKDNFASARTAQALGGELSKERFVWLSPSRGAIFQMYHFAAEKVEQNFAADYEPFLAGIGIPC